MFFCKDLNFSLHDEIKQLKADLERSKSSAGRPISSQFEEFTQRRNPLNGWFSCGFILLICLCFS